MIEAFKAAIDILIGLVVVVGALFLGGTFLVLLFTHPIYMLIGLSIITIAVVALLLNASESSTEYARFLLDIRDAEGNVVGRRSVRNALMKDRFLRTEEESYRDEEPF